MKPAYIVTLLLCCSLVSNAQKLIVIDVEKLERPDNRLPVWSYHDILKNLIRMDHHAYGFRTPELQAKHDPQFNIVAKSNIADSLVSYGYHPFYTGMYNAYASHRPFTLSPDMMWLLICQGFANHVTNNSESLRHLFVNFSGKTTLVVQNNRISLDNPNSPWQEIFPEFNNQISHYTGKELTDALTADFSTTTPTTKIASQITALAAMKSYFDFVVIMVGCGIPQVTLEGTPADWQRVLDKTEALRKYQLDWWVDKMEPLLKEIVKASKGKKNKEFWQTMFKYHSIKRYGASTIIDGWIVKFFPYDKSGRRMNLEALSSGVDLPDEIVKVNLQYIYADGTGNTVSTPLELWAGFVGLTQNDKTFNLRPEIGWMIRKKDTAVEDKNMAGFRKSASGTNYGGIHIRCNAVPEALFNIGPINLLTIDFVNTINIPDELAKVHILKLTLTGVITDEDIKRIKKLFPDTDLVINRKTIVQ